MAESKTGNAKIKVWDLPVRLFHWALVILMVVSFFSGRAAGDWMKLHFWSGYAILALLLFRIAWGFVGSTTARFSTFVKGPTAGLAYLGKLATGQPTYEAGHNPAGGAMVVALIVVLTGTCTTGYMMTTDTFWGAKWVEEVHEAFVSLTIGLVVVHVLGVLLASFEHRESLVKAMITGRKRPS